MDFSAGRPKLGDIVRIKAGGVFHYGIYVSDDEVIQFGMPPDALHPVDKRDVQVLRTDMETFRQGGFPEVARLSIGERLKRFPPEKTVAMARARIGETGYDPFTNNCMHFAMECVFGRRTEEGKNCGTEKCGGSENQPLGIYVFSYPEDAKVGKTGSLLRDMEIRSCRNPSVKAERYHAYRLLVFAMEHAFGIPAEEIGYHKDRHGRPLVNGFHVSISHTDGICAVCVAREPAGIDVEWAQRPLKQSPERIAGAILTETEKKAFSVLAPDRQEAFMLSAWTGKESLFKAFGTGGFIPGRWDTVLQENVLHTRILPMESGKELFIRCAFSGAAALQYLMVQENDGIMKITDIVK